MSIPFMLICLINFIAGPYNDYPSWTVTEIANVVFVGVLTLVFMHYFERNRAFAEDRLIVLAGTDPLTGLHNRRRFQQTLEHSMADTERRKTSFALLVLDLDYFKNINDSLGHDAGDEILQQVADCLHSSVRNTDFISRLGGEEFGVLLRDIDPKRATRLASELLDKLSDWPFSYQDQSVELHATAGVAVFPQDAADAKTLYKIADQNLYLGKQQGRNCCNGTAAAA